jgi:hypothetical protein
MELSTTRDLPRILVVHSGAPDSASEADLAAGMLARMARSGYQEGKNVEISRFYMRSRSTFTGPEQVHRRGLAALAEVERLQPDLVVVLGDPAAREVMLPLVDSAYPVLFGGTVVPPERYNTRKDFMAGRRHPGHNVSGVTGELEIRTTLEAALIAFPRMDRIVFIESGNSQGAMSFATVLKEGTVAFTAAHPEVAVRIEHAATLEDLQELVAKYNADPDTDIVATLLPVGLTRRDGSISPLADTLRWLFDNQHKPGLGFTDNWIRYGYLMGAVISCEATGRQLGTRVVQVLQGANPGDLPVQRPADAFIAVNMARADQLHIRLPLAILEAAGTVFFSMETDRAH